MSRARRHRRQFSWPESRAEQQSLSDGRWHTAALPPQNAKDGDEEERRILGFAPPKHLADRHYTDAGLTFYRQAMRQSGFQRGSTALAQWAGLASGDTPQRAVLFYILEGRQGSELGQLLAENRPDWLPETSDGFRASPSGKSVAPEDLPQLLGLLYPAEQRLLWSGGVQLGMHEDEHQPADPQAFLRRLHDWWRENHQKERKTYEASVYLRHPARLTTTQGEPQMATLRATRHYGRAFWKRWTGYHVRSRIEAKMRCLKAFGERIAARDPHCQTAEIQIRIALMNRFSALGTAQIIRVA